MIENAWDEYRGWAKRSRTLQASVRRWTLAALSCAVLSAVFGAASAQMAAESTPSRVLAGLAAIAAVITPILGRNVLEVGGEAGWIRTRATAEALKSECFLFSAGAGTYAGGDAHQKFIDKRVAITDLASKAGFTPQDDPVKEDKRRPSVPMPLDWYLKYRMQDQAGYYQTRAADYEKQVNLLRMAGLTCALVGAVLGTVASTFQIAGLTPWIGVATTLGAMIIAYGLMERRQYLAASYAAMATALRRLEERLAMSGGVQSLVTEAEALMTGEHAAWVERVTKTTAAPLDRPLQRSATLQRTPSA